MRTYLFSILLLIAAQIAFGQVDGYLIDRNNREIGIVVNIPWTVHGTMNVVQFQKRPKQIVNGKKQVINPNEALEIGFYFVGRKYVYRPVPIRGKLQFKKLILDGPVSVFEELQTPTNQTAISYIPLRSTMTNTRYLICQEGNNAFYPTSWNFKKRLIKKLDKCPSFKEFIYEDDYGLDQVLFIVDQYNTMCQ